MFASFMIGTRSRLRCLHEFFYHLDLGLQVSLNCRIDPLRRSRSIWLWLIKAEWIVQIQPLNFLAYTRLAWVRIYHVSVRYIVPLPCHLNIKSIPLERQKFPKPLIASIICIMIVHIVELLVGFRLPIDAKQDLYYWQPGKIGSNTKKEIRFILFSKILIDWTDIEWGSET